MKNLLKQILKKVFDDLGYQAYLTRKVYTFRYIVDGQLGRNQHLASQPAFGLHQGK